MSMLLKSFNFIKHFSFMIAFLSLLFISLHYIYPNKLNEGMSNNNCPNVLVKDGAKFYLYNDKKAKIPGVNPIEFNNLEEYVEFIEWQKSQNIECPVLFLQKEFNSQGDSTFRARPSPTNLQGGLSENKDHLQANKLSHRAPENNKDDKYLDHDYLYGEGGYNPNEQCHTLIKKSQVVHNSS